VASLLAGSPDVDVLVVDNGSHDGTLAAIAERWPNVPTIQAGYNRGFAGGMNLGIRQAIERGAEYVTILNNDTIVPPGVMALLRDAVGDQTIAVSPEVMYRDEPGRVWFAGGTLDQPDGYPHHTPVDQLEPCQNQIRFTQLLAGCCITASARVWRRVGLFDERFFLNFEDSEWSVRAKRHGVRLAVVCNARILHAVSASFTGSAASTGTYYYVRNGLLFNRSVGGSVRSRLVFLRRHALGGIRDQRARDVARTALLVGWATAAYVFRRFGPAPIALQRVARRWSLVR
jgi:GT2 family glycosyltransferase